MSEPQHPPMDAILFSANPNMVEVDDALKHLAGHEQLYWGVGFRIDKSVFSFPIYGFMHISGQQVEYRATIRDIIPFEWAHYEDEALASQVKPEAWIREWREAPKEEPKKEWRNALVMTEIIPFSYNTYLFDKYEGGRVKNPPQGFIRVFPPRGTSADPQSAPIQKSPPAGPSLAERNLEDFILHQLESIEPGLRLVERQKSTPAGRLDLLCRDSSDSYVVVELKRKQGTDQVMGQILRYMGWLKEAHPTEKVRGIVVVGAKDQSLSYAVMAAPNVQVKEFKIVVE